MQSFLEFLRETGGISEKYLLHCRNWVSMFTRYVQESELKGRTADGFIRLLEPRDEDWQIE